MEDFTEPLRLLCEIYGLRGEGWREGNPGGHRLPLLGVGWLGPEK